MIIPAVPKCGIFSQFASKITSLGAVMVATYVNRFLPGWEVEIIDENNFRRAPVDAAGMIDHRKLQAEYPADAVGFYCGLSSTMFRVWEVAKFYQSQGAVTIAGGWHVRFLPEESLRQGIDIVVAGDGENAIVEILSQIAAGKIPRGIFQPSAAQTDFNRLLMPDFSLIRFAKIKIYPIGRIRGCSMRCEFCSVKDKPRWASANYLFATVQWLVETRRAKSFFITDDRLEEDKPGYLEFFQKIASKYGNKLTFTVQARLGAARDLEFLTAMKAAGVKHVCIGFESPIPEELTAMRKGINVKTMMELAQIWSKNFIVHGMFIFGYPNGIKIPYRQRIAAFKKFIRQSRIHTIQILKPIPLVGTELRERLLKEDVLFPLHKVGWDLYDGNFVCFKPNNMSLSELQNGPHKIMSSFYSIYAWFTFPIRTISMPFDFLIRGWRSWHLGWWRDKIRIGGNILLRRSKRQEIKFLRSLE